MQCYGWLDKNKWVKKWNEPKWKVQYNVLLSSNLIALHKLKPLPATPFCGCSMAGSLFGWAVATLCKASFSAVGLNKFVSKNVQRNNDLPLSFSNFAAYWASKSTSMAM